MEISKRLEKGYDGHSASDWNGVLVDSSQTSARILIPFGRYLFASSRSALSEGPLWEARAAHVASLSLATVVVDY